MIETIPPVALAFYRWALATIILLPFAWRDIANGFEFLKKNFWFFILAAASGVTIFNTLVYVAAHHSTAINLALIGTTTSPVFAVILASVFLREKITWLRISGIAIAIVGICIILSKGNLESLINLSFSPGDWWMIAAALSFAIYNTCVKKKPAGMKPIHFLFITFLMGTLLLLPFFIWELSKKGGISFDWENSLVILYLGLGTSVIAFLCWNAAIMRLGAARTALFGNLIPVFSTIGAVLILNETLLLAQVLGFVVVVVGVGLGTFK